MALIGPRARRLVIGAALAIALLAVFFKGLDWPGVVRAIRSADPLLLCGVVAAGVLTYFFRAWRWGYLLAPLARVPLMRLFSITNVGFATGLVIPRAGEVVRPYLVARHHGLKTSAAFASIILERLFDLITVLALFAAYLYVLPLPAAQVEPPGAALRSAGAMAGAAALGTLVVLLVLTYRRDSALALADRVLAWLPARLGGPLGRALHSFTTGLEVLRASPGHLAAIGVQSLLVWFAITLGIHLNNRAFGVELPFHSTFFMIGFLTVGVAVPTPGMAGGFHWMYKVALLHFAFATDPTAAAAIAAAAALSCHALTNLPVLVLGLFFLGREGLSWGGVSRLAEEPNADVPEPTQPVRSA
jgi:uncharacterized protein (TIRG00374 family)